MRLRLFIASALTFAVLVPAAMAGPIIMHGVKWPDLVVSDLKVFQAQNGLSQTVFDHVSFTVQEACGVKVTKSYHIALKIAASQGAPPLYTTTLLANPLPANGSQSWSIALAGKSFPTTSYVRVDADSNNEIGEDVEGNNYQQLPGAAPFPQNSQTYCKPHKVGVVAPKP